MKSFRKVLFWLHLAAGVTTGVIIFIMCVTGVVLTFEAQIKDYAESGVRYVKNPSEENAQRLSPNELFTKLREAKPDAKPTGLTLKADPSASAAFALGREGALYMNPYTGEILGGDAKGVSSFFRFVTDWHRWLGASGENRAAGKAVTGFSNAAFLILAITGIYIWFPRRLAWQNFKAVLFFRRGLRGKARNFNWHNTIGFWSSLVLIVLTVTGMVISYQWAGNLVYTLTGSEVPPQQQAPPPPQQNQQNRETNIVVPENLDELWTRAAQQTEGWEFITLRVPTSSDAPVVFTIREGKELNPFASSTATFNARSGELTKWESYSGGSAGRRLRSWMRFAHTGESFGIVGQTIAGLASLGGAFLVWTGLSLALRRFRNWRAKKGDNAEPLSSV
ncbi:MAG TPA: PepSY-associated TM helix domain-containing protein [Pyrinomonadaceae bacterium]|nr:PepSY-associated TM helix domain-containing protein [Pyrinomonadaceae bacterium]